MPQHSFAAKIMQLVAVQMMHAEQRLDRSRPLNLAGDLCQRHIGIGSLLDLVGELCSVSMALKFPVIKIQLAPLLSASSE